MVEAVADTTAVVADTEVDMAMDADTPHMVEAVADTEVDMVMEAVAVVIRIIKC